MIANVCPKRTNAKIQPKMDFFGAVVVIIQNLVRV